LVATHVSWLSYSLGDSKAKAEYRGCICFADAAKAFGVSGGKGQYRSCVGLAESVKALKCLEAKAKAKAKAQAQAKARTKMKYRDSSTALLAKCCEQLRSG
jgi:hypothetical protein